MSAVALCVFLVLLLVLFIGSLPSMREDINFPESAGTRGSRFTARPRAGSRPPVEASGLGGTYSENK